MKKFLAFAVLLVSLAAYAQSTTGGDTMESQIRRELQEGRGQNLLTLHAEKPNEVRHGSVSYDGILVQFLKSDNKLQLINPAAPPEYGSGRDNLIEDSASPGLGSSGREGLKLFSLQF